MLSFLPVVLFTSLCIAKPISPDAALAGGAANPAAQKKPASEGVTTFDGVSLAAIPAKPATAQVVSAAISRTGWTCTVDSAQAGNPCTNALDGDGTTFWHSQYSPTLAALPHQITIDMQTSSLIGQITYEPRQDGNSNGNIGQHVISFSNDGTTFTTVAYGTYMDDSSLKTTTFTPINARYMRLQALTEAGNRGPWTSIAEINAFTTGQAAPPSPAGKGRWTYTIDMPLVPVSMANEWSSGNILVWSSYNPSTFGGSSGTQTITATYAPGSQVVTSALVTNTQHDMFCEGLSMDFTGLITATGGNTAAATSQYDNGANTWIKGPAMNIGRGYQSMATTSLGSTFVIGASWSGGEGGKNGELYNPTTKAWASLSGAPVAPILTGDAQGIYRADNHAMLFGWKGGYVFQAGPSKAMNWYLTTGSGTQSAAGTRGNDNDIMCGNAAMYDAVAGKILTAGGAIDYQNVTASSAAHVITIGNGGAAASVVSAPNMANIRSFANSVVLPDGTVLVMGGQTFPNPFHDENSIYVAELYNPATNSWSQLAPAAIPRNYHSTAVLLPDGQVINGGGGLCGVGCATNHFDAQIFGPPYLYTSTGALATRPTINSISVTSVAVGKTFAATTGGAVSYFALMRLSSTTHTVNTDQRRIKLTPTAKSGTTYTLAIPNDAGVALPGYWFVFALDGAGVPSISKTIKITAT